MREPNCKLRRRTPEGFTLPEVLICAVLLVIGFVALLAAFGHESVVAQRGEDITRATFLAEEIRDMALQTTFADVLSLNGTVYDPAILSTGSSEHLGGWAQRLTVTPVSSSDLNQQVAESEAQAARVTVEVFAQGKPVTVQTYYVFDLSGVLFTDSP